MLILYDSVLASFLLVLALEFAADELALLCCFHPRCRLSRLRLTSVPVCPPLIPLSGGPFSTGSDCQSLTVLPSCPALFRLDVGSPLVVCTAPILGAHLCGSRKQESPLLTQEGLALGLTPVCSSPAVLQGWGQCCVLLSLFLSVKQDHVAPLVGQLCFPVN